MGWILAAVLIWGALILLAVALCVMSARADEATQRARYAASSARAALEDDEPRFTRDAERRVRAGRR